MAKVLLWEEVLKESSQMRQMFETKIEQEVAKKQLEIDELKTENEELKGQLDTLALEILNIMGV